MIIQFNLLLFVAAERVIKKTTGRHFKRCCWSWQKISDRAGSATEEEAEERKVKKKKQHPDKRKQVNQSLCCKEYTKATEEREEKRLKEMKDMHKEKMSATSKFLEINWTILCLSFKESATDSWLCKH